MKIVQLLVLSLYVFVPNKAWGDVYDEFFGHHTLIKDSITTTINTFSYAGYEQEGDEVWLRDIILDITIHCPTDSIGYMKDLFDPAILLPYEGYIAYKLLKDDYGDSIRVVFTYDEVELGEKFQYAVTRDGSYWHLIYGIPVLSLIHDKSLLQLASDLAEIRGWTAMISPHREVTIPSSQSGCFDLLGRRLAVPPAKGIYIRDGKKMAAGSATK